MLGLSDEYPSANPRIFVRPDVPGVHLPRQKIAPCQPAVSILTQEAGWASGEFPTSRKTAMSEHAPALPRMLRDVADLMNRNHRRRKTPRRLCRLCRTFLQRQGQPLSTNLRGQSRPQQGAGRRHFHRDVAKR